MSKVKDKRYLCLGLLLGAFLIIIAFTCSFAAKTQIENNKDNWVIQTHQNTVVLLNNGEVVEVFGDISVDSLPLEDREHLKKGISFLTKNEALLAIEDYDG